jgi:hypothetical protein
VIRRIDNASGVRQTAGHATVILEAYCRDAAKD